MTDEEVKALGQEMADLLNAVERQELPDGLTWKEVAKRIEANMAGMFAGISAALDDLKKP